MHRLACVLVVVAACSGGGPGTGAATLTNVMPQVKSASASSFTGADASGTKVLGWTINFYSTAVGSDCTSKGSNVVASIGIFTNQTGSGKAKLELGDISIVGQSPPSTANGAAATMGAMGVSQITGIVHISDYAPDHISGTVSAGGNDTNNAPVSLTGMFTAPDCN